jgi:hypothetical protein
MVSKVTFASARPKEMRGDATLPAVMDRMLGTWDFKKRFKGKRVAIKMHLGGAEGYSTIHPLFVGRVVRAVRQAGGDPFVTDTANAVATARERGYTAETLGAPLLSVAGPADKYFYERQTDFRSLKSVDLAGNIVDSDAMIVLSHGKGHGQSGFGGAIKNIAMGCVSGRTRRGIHMLMESTFQIDHAKCKQCRLCIDGCPNGAISLAKGKINIFDHNCKYCTHCVMVCPNKAITIDQSGYRYFQHGMALTVRETLAALKPENVFYITVLLAVTPFCDCWGMTTPSIVPDIGIVAGDNIVAIETASLDLIKAEDFIKGSLPPPMKRTGKGHLLQQIHGKDPRIQIEECTAVGLGEPKYKLEEID